MATIGNRYDFALFFDVENGNPNGDPDAGNMPRLDPETSQGLVTDVCLKRKVRNYVELTHGGETGYNIYVREKAILSLQQSQAYAALKIVIPDPPKDGTNDNAKTDASDSLFNDGGDQTVVAAGQDGNAPKGKKGKDKKPKASANDIERARLWMCQNFFDVRTFGAVMSLKTNNCGQVRGPVQFAFAKSLDPVVPRDISITRMAVATEKEAADQGGDNRTMGSKFIVPYGLYRVHGFISAPLAERTGFSEADLDLFWKALKNMFEHDRSAARGEMAARKLFVFKHENKLGNAHAHELFDLITAQKTIAEGQPVRAFSDYKIDIDEAAVPAGVQLIRML